jgi:hypothetical protein
MDVVVGWRRVVIFAACFSPQPLSGISASRPWRRRARAPRCCWFCGAGAACVPCWSGSWHTAAAAACIAAARSFRPSFWPGWPSSSSSADQRSRVFLKKFIFFFSRPRLLFRIAFCLSAFFFFGEAADGYFYSFHLKQHKKSSDKYPLLAFTPS